MTILFRVNFLAKSCKNTYFISIYYIKISHYYWINSGARTVFYGGALDNDSRCGLFFWDLDGIADGSGWYIGARLRRAVNLLYNYYCCEKTSHSMAVAWIAVLVVACSSCIWLMLRVTPSGTPAPALRAHNS